MRPASRRAEAESEEGQEESSEEKEVSREAVLAGLLIAALAVVWFTNDARSSALDRADLLEDSLVVFAGQTAQAAQRADSATALAEDAQTRAAAARDSILAVSDTVIVRIAEVSDTIRVLVQDTVALRLIDERDVMFTGIIAGRDSIIARQDSVIGFWRFSSFVKDTVIERWETQYEASQSVNDALRSHIRGQRVKTWGERLVAVGAVACALLC